MKKLVLVLAMACSLQVAFAQKPAAEMQKNVDKALEATKDAKKGAKPATWMKLAEAYMAAYNNPVTNITMGIDKATFQMMNKEKPLSVSNVTIEGQPFEKMEFSNVDVYFNPAGLLAIIDVTHPSIEGDALCEAAKAYTKAYELGEKAEKVDPKLQEIANKYYEDAYSAYQLGNMAKASDLFKGAADVSMMAPCSAPNYDAAYNTAFTAVAAQNYDRAEEYFNLCLKNGYTSDGNIYANLSQCALAKADTLAAKNYLATGLTQFPENESVLTSLINLYLQTNEDPEKIVELLDEAKKVMPDNPSLYYVEGNIYVGVKNYDKAVAAYDKALEIQPAYDFAYYGKGNVALKKAEDLIAERDALDVREWKKYDELNEQVTEVYKGAVEPFEKCYEVSQNEAVKASAADFLKRLCFTLRNVDPKYQEGYDKWSKIVDAAE
jgi:tetratricopeptide (TPR) repeat protein